ncbi:penicillin-binding protein [Sporosarcina sp. P37]|uniref:transglycosylase domain-containing protein n=1 Tax=unclassified Sporosarcina TaxID=2647733 RepID=UPI000A17A312|nr:MULTISPECIES: PBP1A family penicillin-binding protein [unclassified Sporosarcina]ARK25250.1 penicillin-binding protein [Sporosarcina sp. P37]PID17874.1 penicillin-binding protein [Sporosarcina sp. P35]
MKRTDYVKSANRKKLKKITLSLSITLLTAVVTVMIVLRLYAQILGAPSLSVPKASLFLDHNGHQIGDHFSQQRRYWMKISDISPFLADAFVATEDRKFYSHHGFDYKRIAAAVLKDVKTMSKAQGASTITQQYARNLYLTHEKSWTRKIHEALFAYRLEVFYDKDTILEGYLNTVYFGHGMYGVEAASRFYFSKAAKDLTLEEAATIAAIAKGPSIYSPLDHPENSRERQLLVLNQMEHYDYISAAQKERAIEEKIVLKTDSWKDMKQVAPYFLDAAWQEAEDILLAKGRAPAEGGWQIRTTLNQQHQQAAEAAIKEYMPNNDLQVGFISMAADTGFVTSMTGGVDFADSSFNRVTQAKRQPGSAMKPILYAAALEKGMNPLTFMTAEKTIFTYDEGRSTYEPSNINGEFAAKPISLAQAIAISDNVFAVKTLEQVGYKPYTKMAQRLGINVAFPESPAVALGTSELTLLEMTTAYNRIASEGKQVEPHMILSITDANGKLVYEHPSKKLKQVMSEQDAFVLTHLMTGMFDPVFNDYLSSTGLSMRPKQTRPYAAKSGTTISDQYLIGFSPSLTAGIWTGFDRGKQLENLEDKAASKKIWIDFMEAAHEGTAPQPFLPPSGVQGVIVDIETGGIAVNECPKQRLMYLKDKDVPKKLCTDRSLREEHAGEQENSKLELFPFSFFE